MGGNTALPFSFPEEKAKDRISHSISYVKDAECKCTLLRMLRTVEHSQGTSEGEMSRIEDIFKMLKFLNLESWWMMGGWKSLTQLAIVLVCAWLRYAYIFFFNFYAWCSLWHLGLCIQWLEKWTPQSITQEWNIFKEAHKPQSLSVHPLEFHPEDVSPKRFKCSIIIT